VLHVNGGVYVYDMKTNGVRISMHQKNFAPKKITSVGYANMWNKSFAM